MGINLASPVDDRLSEVGGGGGGARVCVEAIAGLEPGIGGTRLARLFCVPGVVGDAGLGSVAKYDPLFIVGRIGEARPPSRVGRLGAAAGLGGASPVGVFRDTSIRDSSSSDSDPALGDIGVANGGRCGRAVYVSIQSSLARDRLTLSRHGWRCRSPSRNCWCLERILTYRS